MARSGTETYLEELGLWRQLEIHRRRAAVVIGGQAFSLSFAGYMHYHIPVIPHSFETFKEGVFGAMMVIGTPFVLFWLINKFVPSLRRDIGAA